MHNQEMKHLMRGAWILSLSSLIAKILSAVYRVPFQNMVGDTGFYALSTDLPDLRIRHDIRFVRVPGLYF